jgi:hypothetical protein
MVTLIFAGTIVLVHYTRQPHRCHRCYPLLPVVTCQNKQLAAQLVQVELALQDADVRTVLVKRACTGGQLFRR